MDAVLESAARLIERAQSGEADQVLEVTDRLLRAGSGDLVEGPPALHFARLVALAVTGDAHAAISGADLMIAAADREGVPGWRSCALSIRAEQRFRLGEQDAAEHDPDAILRDLVDAEASLRAGADDDDPFVTGHAHTGVALGYHALRLYELAVPHYLAACDVTSRSDQPGDDAAMWLLNLTNLHLQWALELYRVGQPEVAEKHSRQAEDHALTAAAAASGPDGARWRDMARLLAACSRADGDDPAAAVADITAYSQRVAEHGMEVEFSGVAPFHAVALRRSGHLGEALAVIEKAVRELAPSAPWTAVAAATHTRAQLLALSGSGEAAAALSYGDALAQALWRQRLRTLHVAETMQSYENLRVEHALVSHSARTDPLTGIANRRAFDDAVRTLGERPADGRYVAVLMVDLDRFKEVNDTCGHETGDTVLRAVATALSLNLRDGDLVVRLGGDEFAALLPGASEEAALRVARRMVQAVDAIEDCVVTASIGVASGPTEDVLRSVGDADRSMYAAKRRGGNRVGGGRLERLDP